MLSLLDFQPYEVSDLIRCGSDHDGGYLIPASIQADKLISFGLGDNWEFELDLMRNRQVCHFLVFDHSVGVRQLLLKVFSRLVTKNFQLKSFAYRLIILIKYLRDFTFKRNLHIKKKIIRIKSNESNSKTANLDGIFEAHVKSSSQLVILKVDIEGCEYEIVEDIMKFSSQILLIIIEFHDIHAKAARFKQLLDLIKTEFSLVHTHANNYAAISSDSIPDVCELTLIKNSHFKGHKLVKKLPRKKLDSPSTPDRADYSLNFVNVC